MAGNTTVLLVEDNPLVMSLLERALAPLASVTTATNAAAALAHAAENAPDLVIADYRMPGMNGRELLDELKSRPATARVPVILAASRTDVSERLKPVQDLVEDFLEKPFFVAEAKARIKRILDKIALEKMAREAPGETVLRGSLTQMSIIDLLQTLELGRKTGGLALTRGAERCELFFCEGQITHATYGDLIGDAAVYNVLTWPEGAGSFQIDFAMRTAQQTTTRSTQGLLMEGLRMLDEANRDAADILET
jgi:CheY-like chemotaxis protein